MKYLHWLILWIFFTTAAVFVMNFPYIGLGLYLIGFVFFLCGCTILGIPQCWDLDVLIFFTIFWPLILPQEILKRRHL